MEQTIFKDDGKRKYNKYASFLTNAKNFVLLYVRFQLLINIVEPVKSLGRRLLNRI